MLRRLKVNDLFCGGGGMGLGFKNAGWEIAGAWDWDPYGPKVTEQPQIKAYKNNVGEHVKQQDITKMIAADLPRADCYAFGFPCQDLSKNGSKKGLVNGKNPKCFLR